ncbi:uncharacterized protein LOC121569937 [Coregonus clupeaformis]|uniref:uncharacterized protein LOC121569937 n=1 Tax=Coregonus clupeaformis TaxID=59861 RepID=UPI001E1C2C28|nr:uncharacterized protein LOC121569937 [Coregonus clupeaformis]
MSQGRTKASMVFSWQKSFAILNPWRKGKGDNVLENEVVLTKMKLFNNFHEKTLNNADDSSSTISMSVSEQDISEPVKGLEGNADLDNMPGQPLMESSSDYLSDIFSDSQLPMLYKFESEDSGVELLSGTNSPSTPTGSEQSFMVHSREPSYDSCNLNTPVPTPDPLLTIEQCSDTKQTEDIRDTPCTTVDNAVLECDIVESGAELNTEVERVDLHITEKDINMERAQHRALKDTAEDSEGVSEQLGENRAVTEGVNSANTRPRSQCSTGACDDMTGVNFEQRPLRKSTTSDSLEKYMEECCRLSEVHQASSNPLGSGLGYLEHICQLIEKIGQLQEHNLRLQKQICGLQKDGRMTKTKEDFFLQHCSCGTAGMAFQEQKRHSRSEFLTTSMSGTLSDLSTIPEVTRHTGLTARGESDQGGCQPLVPLWKRGLNRRSYKEGDTRSYLCDSTEGLSAPHRRLSENYTWGRVKDLVKKTKLRNQSRLGQTSTSLKRSCPQLYRPDLGPVELPGRNRNSMIALGHQNKLDFQWPQ